jgi:hypothetical protein
MLSSAHVVTASVAQNKFEGFVTKLGGRRSHEIATRPADEAR